MLLVVNVSAIHNYRYTQYKKKEIMVLGYFVFTNQVNEGLEFGYL